MTTTELAWAAGLFEGEGCFSPRRPRVRGSMHLYAAIAMTDEDVIRRFADVIGFGRIRYQPGRRKGKPTWCWYVNGPEVERLYDLIGPWFGERRSARYAELVAERRAFEADRPRRRRKTHCQRGHPFDEENTYVHKRDGRRHCRACVRMRKQLAMSVLEAATEAANRIIHGDTSQDDVQLVAGVLLQILAQPRWSSEFRTGTEWVPLDVELTKEPNNG